MTAYLTVEIVGLISKVTLFINGEIVRIKGETIEEVVDIICSKIYKSKVSELIIDSEHTISKWYAYELAAKGICVRLVDVENINITLTKYDVLSKAMNSIKEFDKAVEKMKRM